MLLHDELKLSGDGVNFDILKILLGNPCFSSVRIVKASGIAVEEEVFVGELKSVGTLEKCIYNEKEIILA